jgi:hypothetical protein
MCLRADDHEDPERRQPYVHTVHVGSKGTRPREAPSPRGTSSNVRGWRRVNHTPEGYATTPSLRVFLGTATFFANLIRRVMGADRRR